MFMNAVVLHKFAAVCQGISLIFQIIVKFYVDTSTYTNRSDELDIFA